MRSFNFRLCILTAVSVACGTIIGLLGFTQSAKANVWTPTHAPGMCIQASQASYSHLFQSYCHYNATQQFDVQWMDRGYQGDVYRIIHRQTGRCVAYGNGENGAAAYLAECNHPNGYNTFVLAPVGNSWRAITTTGRCLDVAGVSQNRGASLIVWDCWGGANQHFWVY